MGRDCQRAAQSGPDYLSRSARNGSWPARLRDRVGAALVANPHIKAVGFTGSRAGGLALLAIVADRPEPILVFAEMSTVNTVVPFSHALAARGEALGSAFVGSLTVGSGQLCTNPVVVLAVEGPGIDDFVRSAANALRQSPAQVMLTSGVHEAYDRGVAAFEGKSGAAAG